MLQFSIIPNRLTVVYDIYEFSTGSPILYAAVSKRSLGFLCPGKDILPNSLGKFTVVFRCLARDASLPQVCFPFVREPWIGGIK